MTKTVTISALRADGTPYAHHDVIVTLVAGSAGGVVGSNVVVESSKVRLDANGAGSIVLSTNDVEITSPSTSFYRFTVEGSSPTITRSIRLTNALASSVSWALAGIQVGDPTTPDRDVSSDYVTVAGESLTNYLTGVALLDEANEFTAAQSIDVTVPVTPVANIGTTKPTVLLHIHAGDGAIVNYALTIDAGGAIGKSTGVLAAVTGADGLPTDEWLILTTAPGIEVLSVTSTDPGKLPWISDILAAVPAVVTVGTPTADTHAATKAYVDAHGGGGVSLGETSTTAYRGDRGKTGYDHSQVTSGNPHGTTAADVGAAATSHSHAASAVTSGTLDIARIPTGATGSTVPFGNDARFNAGPSPAMFPVAVGQWFANPHDTVYDSATTLNRVLFVPIWIPSDVTAVDAVEVHVATVGAASAVVRLGLHLPHATTKFPDALVIDAGTLDATATGGTGARQITFASTPVTPNSLAFVSVDSQGAICTLKYSLSGQWLTIMGVPSSTGLDVLRATTGNGWYQTGVTGGFGATASPTYAASTAAQPVVALRKA